MSVLFLALGPDPAWAASSEWEEYVERAIGEWRDGPERKKLQEAMTLLQRNTERINSSLRMATETAEAMSTQIRQSGVLEKVAQLETATKEAEARLAARWERERAAREREREQREREAGERAREQRR
jgi:predicted  nucleic acid-binding Zn-ribbon protein